MERREIGKWRMLLGVGMAATGMSVCFWFASLLRTLLFHSSEPLPSSWDYILTGLLGMCIFFVFGKIASEIHTKRQGKHGDYRHQLLDETLEALNRISRGDFSVMLETREHDPLSELAESVNKMARELGSMENLRQDFISNVSHEMQSPLTSISGFAALLKNDALPPEHRMHYLDVIETEAKRLSKLSDNLLKLTSLENNAQPLVRTSFRMDKQIQNAALLLEPQWAEKQLDLSLRLEKVSYTGDEGLLTQIWVNLLNNAIKFTPESGSIEVSLTQDDSLILFNISDTGVGISTEDQLHIFERFYKADKSRDRSLGGNGLGLSLVKKIVELHRGTIAVESTLGKGAKFTVKLPLE